MKVANRYFSAIALQIIGGLFFVIISLTFMDSFVPIIGIAGLATCALALNRELQNRRREMDRALAAARADIDARIKEIRESIENARREFEESEDRRIQRIERLLDAEPAAVFERLAEVLQNFRLPFYMRCSVDIYDTEPVLTLYLPGHNVIPTNIISLTPTGVIEYEEKSAPDVNRQYSEALAGTAMTLALLLYSYLPPIDVLYVRGLLDRREVPDCLYSLKFTRQTAQEALGAASALDAFEHIAARYEIGPNGIFTHQDEELLPDWWSAVPDDERDTAKITILSRF